MSPLVCFRCGNPLPGSRLVIHGRWMCADCPYGHDCGTSPSRQSSTKRELPRLETLFPNEELEPAS
jgi:hypothetical protein